MYLVQETDHYNLSVQKTNSEENTLTIFLLSLFLILAGEFVFQSNLRQTSQTFCLQFARDKQWRRKETIKRGMRIGFDSSVFGDMLSVVVSSEDFTNCYQLILNAMCLAKKCAWRKKTDKDVFQALDISATSPFEILLFFSIDRPEAWIKNIF